MIGTEILYGQGLGNQLFCYVTARCIALERGVAFGTAGREQLAVNMHSHEGMYFMDLDLGEAVLEDHPQGNRLPDGPSAGPTSGIKRTKDGDVLSIYQEKEVRLFLGTSRHDLQHGAYVAGEDETLYSLPDNTLIYGNMQAESYFAPYRDQIREWLRVLPEYDSREFTRDNLCILHVRGGDYEDHPELVLRRKYWLDGMKNMRRIRPDMEFIIVTDDPEAARKTLPGLPVYRGDLGHDYVMLKNARYLLLGNSSFAFFPAYTSDTLEYAIAPKYWARHNVSDGYWASEQNIYSIFHYQDRKGRLFTPEECHAELEHYKKTSGKYRCAGQRPQGMMEKLAVLECRMRYAAYYGTKAWHALRRRMGYKVPYAGQ